ncbi:MAG: hypothetical protein P4L40_09520 [Terracidiphilus sp.]|nr:hypothetical protein [Terracidiphilus sp.]
MTPLGYILLPVGLAGLFFSTKWLYRLFVFWTLFSASSVMNFGEGESGSALQVWMFFGVLWLLRLILDHLSTLSFSIDRRMVRQCLWLIAFLFIASLSLMMPVYINGSLAITSPYLGDGTQTPLYLTSHNFTQLLYLIFGVMIAICVAHSNLRDVDRHETEQIILLSALFISVWGLVQFFCNLTGVPYPDYIFNNSGSPSGKGFLQTLDVGVSRISSATLEPSIFATSLVAVLPLTLPAWLRRGSVLSIAADRYCTVLFVVLLILCTSSSAYLGLFILAILIWFLLLRTRTMSVGKAAKFAVIAGAGAVTAVVLAIASIPIARSVVSSVLLDKSSSASALERAMTVGLAFGYFQKYPILGVGWGSVTSHDLIVYLLANVGIAGTVIFLGATISVLRANWRTLGALVLPESLSRFAWLLAFAAFIFTSLFAGFPLVLGNFWLVLGMAISTGSRTEKRRESTLVKDPV